MISSRLILARSPKMLCTLSYRGFGSVFSDCGELGGLRFFMIYGSSIVKIKLI